MSLAYINHHTILKQSTHLLVVSKFRNKAPLAIKQTIRQITDNLPRKHLCQVHVPILIILSIL